MALNVLMVCLGNICRSPLAEGILQAKVDSNVIHVASAGTAGYHQGNPPDPRSIATAAKYGLDISRQRSRKFELADFDRFDVIYAMDFQNRKNLQALARTPSEHRKIKLLLAILDEPLQEVPDPYYGGDDGFEQIYHLMNRACTAIAHELESPTP